MSITAFFDRGCLLNADATAYAMDQQTWSYRDAQNQSYKVAHALQKSGAPRQAKAAVLAGNHPVAWMCVLGLWRAGLCWVPLNPRSTVEESQQLLEGFDVEVLFFQEAFASQVESFRATCPQLKWTICIDGEPTGATSLDTWTQDQPTSPLEALVEAHDLAAIMPTGGTTGRPKGVMLSHRNLTVSVTQSVINTPYAPGESIVNLAAAPMTHSAGFLTLPASARGGKVVILTKPDPSSLLNAVEQQGVTELFLPPTVIYRLLELPDLKSRDLSSLRYFMYGAAPMAVDKLRQALSAFGPVMLQGYGQTEAPGCIAFLRPGDHFIDGKVAPDNRLSACGLPAISNETAILDESGKPVVQGQAGEICVRGDIVMQGYYRQPDKTAETIVNGWLHTGDVGFIDTEGFLHITDRRRDVIISGGFNVYPSEVEQVLWSHPSIMDCAVIGVPDEKWGECVKAVVELKQGCEVDADELIALCKEKLGSVKAPKSVDFIETLPRSPVGKVLKKSLRDMYWQGQGRQI